MKNEWKAHTLTGDRKGVWALHVTRNWRLTFSVDTAEREIFDVNFEYVHIEDALNAERRQPQSANIASLKMQIAARKKQLRLLHAYETEMTCPRPRFYLYGSRYNSANAFCPCCPKSAARSSRTSKKDSPPVLIARFL